MLLSTEALAAAKKLEAILKPKLLNWHTVLIFSDKVYLADSFYRLRVGHVLDFDQSQLGCKDNADDKSSIVLKQQMRVRF